MGGKKKNKHISLIKKKSFPFSDYKSVCTNNIKEKIVGLEMRVGAEN